MGTPEGLKGGVKIAVIGAGPAGLMAAERLATMGHAVTIYERMPRPARKFLLAGRGGLNLTHSEPLDRFLTRYREHAPTLDAIIRAFSPEDLRRWAHDLGQETFIGTSGRVFPKAMKTSPLLRAWLSRLSRLGVRLEARHTWLGWDESGALRFATPEGDRTITADATILALGGASWPHLGGDGSWRDTLIGAGTPVTPFAASNAGVLIAWPEEFKTRFHGAPLKRISATASGETRRGEAVITRQGLEGGAVYALSSPIRQAIARDGAATLHLDLKPDIDEKTLVERLSAPRAKQSLSTFLRKRAALEPVQIGLMHLSARANATQLTAADAASLARAIKDVPLTVTATAGLDRAISTAGGVAFEGLDEGLMLKARPGVFVCGEMIEWDAPTGGYLLQASFATANWAAAHAARWLTRDAECTG